MKTRSVCTVPSFHYSPTTRVQKPLNLVLNTSQMPPPMRQYKFRHVQKRMLPRKELIFDPTNNVQAKGMSFAADFEGGNCGIVWRLSPKTYEIRMLPDPSRQYSATWFFFRVDNIPPGEYTFIISGFFRDAQLHYLGVQPTALSINKLKRGIGWERIGNKLNFWCSKQTPIAPEYNFSFSFTVTQKDTMYFSYLYPYNYTDVKNYLSKKNLPFTVIGKTHGGLELPALFWDADEQNFKQPVPSPQTKTIGSKKKPLIVIAARLHPGESNSSYAMEGFMTTLFNGSEHSSELLSNFSFLLLPMMNPDGVVCGYYRPQLNGIDLNRVWKHPEKNLHPEAYAVTRLLDNLVQTRPLLFLLDFHGHTAQCNAFSYGIRDPHSRLNEYQDLFPRLMGRICDTFDVQESISFLPREYPSTMRVALHYRYNIPFAYTLEMSFGGCLLGNDYFCQMTEASYRNVGISTVEGIYQMLLVHCPINKITDNYIPPRL